MLAQIKKWFSSASEPRAYVVLSLNIPDSLPAELGFAIRNLLNQQKTEGWWFLNPDTFVAVFLSSASGKTRAQLCQQALEKTFSTYGGLSKVRIKCAEGDLIEVEKGRFVGNSISEAMNHG